MKHLTEEQLFAIVDGGVPPNQQGSLLEHLSGCAECRQAQDEIASLCGDVGDLPVIDERAHVERVMVSVRARSAAPRPIARSAARWRPRIALGALAISVAAAAGWLAVRDRTHAEEFASRSAAQGPSLRRNVGMRVFTGLHRLEPLRDGETIAPDASFTAAYTNREAHAACAVVFAVDDKQAVHWLYPAHLKVEEDPSSIALEPSAEERALPTSVVLEDPAEGPLRVFTVVTETPIHVSDIEKRSPAELDRSTLERDFGAVVNEIRLDVRSKQ